MAMLTRARVAKRLGRSIATVRRMEGHELHPWTDARGVHQFDSSEVEQLARSDRGHEPHGDELPAPFADAEPSDAQHRIERLELELSQAQQALRDASQRAAQLDSQNQELRTTSIEALEIVIVLLGSETPFPVRHCLNNLRRRR